jgi:hypothetical protein
MDIKVNPDFLKKVLDLGYEFLNRLDAIIKETNTLSEEKQVIDFKDFVNKLKLEPEENKHHKTFDWFSSEDYGGYRTIGSCPRVLVNYMWYRSPYYKDRDSHGQCWISFKSKEDAMQALENAWNNIDNYSMKEMMKKYYH